MTDVTITRSFSRTKQVSQFEPFTAFGSYTVLNPTTEEVTKLNQDTVLELEEQLEAYINSHSEAAGVGIRRLAEMVIELAQQKPLGIAEFEMLSSKESILINEVKKALYRTDSYKNRKSNSNIDNESNRKQ